MKKEDLELLTFEELQRNFLMGQYDDNWEEHNNAMNELHSKLPSIADLVPLLKSNSHHCQYTAAYISALEGERARPIFHFLFELLESPWVDVRYEVCDCFLSCAKEPAHYIALFSHLSDLEESIRLRVITILCGLEGRYIEQISIYLKDSDGVDKNIINGVSLLLNQFRNSLSSADMKNEILMGSKEVKIFSYVAAYREFGDGSKLSELANLSKEPDLLRHWEIYFGSE